MSEYSVEEVTHEIRRRSDQFEDHFRNGRARELVRDYYVEDEPRMSAPDVPLMRSHAQIVELFEALIQSFEDCHLFQEEVRVSGDRAYELGGAKVKPRNPEDPAVDCRYLIVWKKSEDGWRVETDFFAYGNLL